MRVAATTGEMPIVDCDVHPLIKDARLLEPYLSQTWRRHFETRGIRMYARARDRYNHPNRTYRLDALPASGGPAGSDPAYTLEHFLEPFGITTAMLLPQEPYGVTVWGDADAAGAFVRANNDYLLDNWVGIVYHQSGNEGCYTSSLGPAGGIPRSYGERHVVLTQVGAANITDLVVGGVFERFPELRVVMVEWGFSWLTALLARLDHFWAADPGAAPLVKQPPSEYVAEHVTFTTQPLDEPDTKAELDALFAIPNLDRMLLFSSDYPHYDTDDPSFIIKRIPRHLRPAVCYQNAVNTFGPKALRSLGEEAVTR